MQDEISYNIAVVDDTRIDSEKLQRSIHKWFSENHAALRNVTCYPDGLSLLRNFEPQKFHIVFMDILMDNLNGIDTARRIRDKDNKLLLVFTTSSQEFAFEAFPLHAFDYVLKPYDSKRLAGVLSEAVKIFETPEPSLNAKVSHSTYTIPFRKISSVISRDHFVEVIMSDGNCMLCSMKFSEVKSVLSEDKRFLECSRGVMINMDCVSSLSREKLSFIMSDGTYYPLKVREKNNIISTFTQYQISRMRGGG